MSKSDRPQSNRPQPWTPQEVREWLADTEASLVQRRDEILAGYARFSALYANGIPDEEVQGRAADFAGAKGIMGAFLKECDVERIKEKLPYRLAGEAVDGFFKLLSEPVEKCQHDVRAKMAVFASKLEAERREAARLEAERLAAEAAAAEEQATITLSEADLQAAMDTARAAEIAQAEAEAKASELSRTRGDLGTVVSLRVRYVADLEASDLMALVKAVAEGRAPLDYLTFNATRIGYAVRSEKIRDIPGVVIREERSVV